MYRSIYKSYCVAVTEEDKCVIDSNGRVAERIEEFHARQRELESSRVSEDGEDDFVSGLEVGEADAQAGAETGEDGAPIIKAASAQAPDLDAVREEAEQILEDARMQAEQIKEDAKAEMDSLRRQTLDRAEKNGYDDGYQRGLAEADEMKQKLGEERQRLEEEYSRMIDELEPKFIETITEVYSHLFQTDLSDNRDILVHLVDSALRKVESSRTFLVHVSSEDYPYVNMQKQALAEGPVGGKGILEIVEDIALSKGDCLIETDGGIFDCGIGTQLEELTKKLRVLSFDGTNH